MPYSSRGPVDEALARRVIDEGLVDEAWYRAGDAAPSGLSVAEHFLTIGWRAGRSPNPFFDPVWYLQANPDVARAGVDALAHYLSHGEEEGRWPSPLFHPAWYAAANGLASRGGGAVLGHYLRCGCRLGLQPNPAFDPVAHLQAHPELGRDLRRAALDHGRTAPDALPPGHAGPAPRPKDDPRSDRLATDRILLVGHDANAHGAQLILLNIGRTLVERFGFEVTFLLLQPGVLLGRFQEAGTVVLARSDPAALDTQLDAIAPLFPLVFANTAVSGDVAAEFHSRGAFVVSLIHELPRLIEAFGIGGRAARMAAASDVVVFPSDRVRSAFEKSVARIEGRVATVPQGLYAELPPVPDARARLRARLGLTADTEIVINVGFGDLRKGGDLFCEAARHAGKTRPHRRFVWVGDVEPSIEAWIFADPLGADRRPPVLHLPFTDEVGAILQGADLFFLSSREDPYPSSVIEALACGLPVVAFASRSGIEALVAQHGAVVPAYDTAAVLAAMDDLMGRSSPDERARRAAAIRAAYDQAAYVGRLLDLCGDGRG